MAMRHRAWSSPTSSLTPSASTSLKELPGWWCGLASPEVGDESEGATDASADAGMVPVPVAATMAGSACCSSHCTVSPSDLLELRLLPPLPELRHHLQLLLLLLPSAAPVLRLVVSLESLIPTEARDVTAAGKADPVRNMVEDTYVLSCAHEFRLGQVHARSRHKFSLDQRGCGASSIQAPTSSLSSGFVESTEEAGTPMKP